MDGFQLNKENEEKVNELEKLHSNIYQKSIRVIESRNAKNIQHQILFVCLARIIKYFEIKKRKLNDWNDIQTHRAG